MIRHRSFSPEAGHQFGSVLLDVDGTLLSDSPDELSGRLLWHIAETTDLIHDDATLQHLHNLRDIYGSSSDLTERRRYFDPVIHTLDPLVAHEKRATIHRLALEVIHKVIDENELFPEVLTEVHELQAEGRYVGLISGSPDFLIQKLAAVIGVDFATGTRFYKAGDNSFHPTRPAETRGRNKHCIAESMLVDLSIARLRQLGRASITDMQHRPQLQDIPFADRFYLHSAYGDTINDLGMLQMADWPVAVAPKDDLLQIATDNKWRIISPAARATPQSNQQKVGIR